MTYVYILNTYHEDGAENVKATLDRSRLAAMIDLLDGNEDWKAETKAGLIETLKESDEVLCARDGVNLTEGWGGAQLHVVELVVGHSRFGALDFR